MTAPTGRGGEPARHTPGPCGHCGDAHESDDCAAFAMVCRYGVPMEAGRDLAGLAAALVEARRFVIDRGNAPELRARIDAALARAGVTP